MVMSSMVLLLGMAWMQQPQLFKFNKVPALVEYADVPKYYAYVQPAEDNVPLVAGANTNDGPSVINDDGTVSQVDMGQVLGASTEGVVLSLDEVKVNAIPDTPVAIQKYFADSKLVETGPIDNSDFEAALSSSNQVLIDVQAKKLTGIKDALQKLSVPTGLVKLHKLKIIQYGAAIAVLENFTQADQNPELVGSNLQNFLKSQQDIDAENASVAQKYPSDVPIEISVTAASPQTTDLPDSNAQ